MMNDYEPNKMSTYDACRFIEELIEVANACKSEPGSRGSFRIVMFERDIEALEVAHEVLKKNL